MFITDNISLIGHILSNIFGINNYETLSVHNFAVSKAYGNFIYIFFLNEKPSSHSIYDRYWGSPALSPSCNSVNVVGSYHRSC